jgi:biofilm PGA synthesis N-glycosyltransferase PgaC
MQDPVNRGKAARLNLGFQRARHELVIVCDADTHMHPLAPKLLVARMLCSKRLTAAVAAGPHVTNRANLLCAMQVLETASIIGLTRRSQALRGRVGTVAGVLGLFRREAVLAVGGYREQMATEDIDLTWRLLIAGWHTSFEPAALIGMQVPAHLSALWGQRRRWARGQGEVLHEHFGAVLRWRQRGMWLIAFESIASLLWVVAWALAVLVAGIDLFFPSWALRSPGPSRPQPSPPSRWHSHSRSTPAMTGGRSGQSCSARSTHSSSGRSQHSPQFGVSCRH